MKALEPKPCQGSSLVQTLTGRENYPFKNKTVSKDRENSPISNKTVSKG